MWHKYSHDQLLDVIISKKDNTKSNAYLVKLTLKDKICSMYDFFPKYPIDEHLSWQINYALNRYDIKIVKLNDFIEHVIIGEGTQHKMELYNVKFPNCYGIRISNLEESRRVGNTRMPDKLTRIRLKKYIDLTKKI